MAIFKPVTLGQPVLLQVAQEVSLEDKNLDKLVQDMLDTMHHYSGAGLAAPQIGVSKRVIVYGFDKNPRYPDARPIPLRVLLNPEFIPIGAQTNVAWEACLSVPGLRSQVERFSQIEYLGYDYIAKKFIKEVASDFHARVIQHEIDHLNGTLFPFKTEHIQTLSFEENL